MTNEQGDEASIANAANWLRLIFHSLTCNNPACVLHERCSGGKALLSHVLTCTNQGACVVPSCTSVRRLTLHWLRCQDTHCRLCAGVWRDLSGHDGVNEQRQLHRPRERQAEPLPPEAPGTPDRNADVPFSPSNPVDGDRNTRTDVVVPSGRGRGINAGVQIGDGDADYNLDGHFTDRAVVQLQEATSYLRYLLYCLMCRNARDTATREPGLIFWLNTLTSPPQAYPLQEAALAAVSTSAAGRVPAAGVAAAVAAGLPSAGRRLLGHRLICRNPFCALCSGTCDLFTRGQGLRRELPAPGGLHDMDLIVHELSLALGSVNL